MSAALGILFVFIGCCTNVIFLELLIKEKPGSGCIITCAQFLFISLHGFIFTSNFGKKQNVIPIKDYLILVIMFFLVNVSNNLAFSFKISMPLHMIFKSGGLIANMMMAIIVLGRSYPLSKYLSVALITTGTAICTIASAENLEEVEVEKNNGDDNVGYSLTFVTWLMGIGLLTFALFMSARMGIFQECLHTKHGKHPKEALYYIHMLSLPGFLMTSSSIMDHAIQFSQSLPLPALAAFPVLCTIPRLWLYLVGNMLTQYLCISSVFKLTSECTSLTVTLVITLRKFLSLIFSIIYFDNTFLPSHWIGTFFVFGGILFFTDVYGMVKDYFDKNKLKKSN